MRKLSAFAALALALAAALLTTACGGVQTGAPPLSAIPLVPGTRVVAHIRRCDRGANAFCAVQAVVVGDGYPSSAALMMSETRHLKALGWAQSQGDTGAEKAADSPGNKMRLIYATAADDLRGADLGWIRRAPLITTALAHVMFQRSPALSLLIQRGSA